MPFKIGDYVVVTNHQEYYGRILEIIESEIDGKVIPSARFFDSEGVSCFFPLFMLSKKTFIPETYKEKVLEFYSP